MHTESKSLPRNLAITLRLSINTSNSGSQSFCQPAILSDGMTHPWLAEDDRSARSCVRGNRECKCKYFIYMYWASEPPYASTLPTHPIVDTIGMEKIQRKMQPHEKFDGRYKRHYLSDIIPSINPHVDSIHQAKQKSRMSYYPPEAVSISTRKCDK